jgi:hypothetical protein
MMTQIKKDLCNKTFFTNFGKAFSGVGLLLYAAIN